MNLLVAALLALALAAALGAAGVLTLFGVGWMLIFLAACSAGLAIVLLRGLIHG